MPSTQAICQHSKGGTWRALDYRGQAGSGRAASGSLPVTPAVCFFCKTIPPGRIPKRKTQ